MSFTGLNQDTVGGLYDADAREYSIQGRWPSPDPAGVSSMHVGDPQTLDRYAYVRNNPLGYVDPSGLDWWDWGGGGFGDGIWGELPPWGAPRFPTGPNGGIDWTTLIFGPPDPGLLIMDECAGPGCAYTPPSIRSRGQTFGNCMEQHKDVYSVGGVWDLLFGTHLMNNGIVNAIAGNSVGGIVSAVSGNAKDAAVTMATNAPELVKSGIGSGITAGRRTADLTALNIAGKGGLSRALSSSSNGVKSLLGSVGRWLNLGMKASVRAAIDLGLYGAEALGCSVPQ